MTRILGFGMSSAFTALLRALSLPLMGWLVAPELLAAYALWQLALGLFTMLAGLGLGHALVREFHAAPVGERSLLLAHILLVSLGAVLPIAVCAVLLSLSDSSSAYLNSNNAVLFLVAGIVLNLYITSGAQYIRLQQWPVVYAQIQVGGSLLWLMLLISAWILPLQLLRLEHLLLLWVIANLLNAAWLTWVLRGDLQLINQQRAALFTAHWRKRLRQMFRYGHPLLLSETLYWIMSALGAILLTLWHGLETVAVYAMAVAIGSAGSMAGQVFNTVWLPEVYRSHQANSDMPWLRSAALKILWASIVLVLLATAGGFVFVSFLPDHYASVPYLVAATFMKPMLMALQRVTAIGIELQRTTWVSPLAMAMALTVQLLLAWWLIPLYAAAGAVISMTLAAWLFWQLKSIASSLLWRSVGGVWFYLPMLILLLAACGLAIAGANQAQ